MISRPQYRLLCRAFLKILGRPLGEEMYERVCREIALLNAAGTYRNFEEFYERFARRHEPGLIQIVAERINCGFTVFNRHPESFRFLERQILPRKLATGGLAALGGLNVWCSGCATGQEAYLLAASLDDFLRRRGGRLRRPVLATDLSENALRHAKKGIFATRDLIRAPKSIVHRYFVDGGNSLHVATPYLKSRIDFRAMNLVTDPLEFEGTRWDVIFCHNVLHHFNPPTLEKILVKMEAAMASDGHLLMAPNEILPARLPGGVTYRQRAPGIYQKFSRDPIPQPRRRFIGS